MNSLPLANTEVVLTRNGRVVGRIAEATGLIEPAEGRGTRIELRGPLLGRPSYWIAEGVVLDATWTLGSDPKAGRIGAPLSIMRWNVDTGVISLAAVARLTRGGIWKGPMGE
jgi:hypothetical protein